MSLSTDFPQEHILPLLACAHHTGQRYLDRRLRQYDLTPAQAHTMLFLLRETPQREVNQKDLEQHLHIRPSTVCGIVERLEQKGYLLREASQTDARRRSLRVTERGRNFFESEFAQEAGAAERRVTSLFCDEELAQLRSMLRRIIQSMQSEETEA